MSRFLLLLVCCFGTACASHSVPLPVPARSTGALPEVARVPVADRDCLALNLYWEARGEGRLGMVAVGWTVLNRVRSRHFPASVCAVVYEGGERPPCQFSWWCDGRSDRPREWQSWRQAQRVATELLSSPPKDPTAGSLFYHATSIDPPWRRPRMRTARIGRHVFYR